MVKCSRKTLPLSDLWVSSNDKLSDFYTSSWQPGDSPLPLLLFRLLLTLMAVAILGWALWNGRTVYWLIYLTNWGLLCVSIMLINGLAISIMAIYKKIPDTPTDLPWYVSTYWLFHNIAVTVAITITALYWILLYNPEAYEDVSKEIFYLDVATHGVNSLLALTEVVLSRTPVRIAHIYQPLGVGLWYAAFSAIYYVAGGRDINGNPFIYEVLDWRQGKRSSIVVTASAVMLVIIYMVVWLIAFLRDKMSSAIFRSSSVELHLPTGNIDIEGLATNANM